MAFTRTVVILGVRDVGRSAAWFRDELGFHLDPDTGVFEGVDADEGAVYAVLDRDGVGVHLQIRRLDLPAEREEVETDAYFYVDDVDALHDEYRGRGVTIFRELYDEPYGMRDFAVETPDGHRLAFGSPLT